jgi:hypothetical protein
LEQKKVTTRTGSHGTVVVTHEQKVRAWMQVIISLFLLVAGILRLRRISSFHTLLMRGQSVLLLDG